MPSGYWCRVLGTALHDLGKLPLRADQEWVHDAARRHCRAATPHASFSSCHSCQAEFGYLDAFLSWALVSELLPPPWAERAAAIAGVHRRPQGWEAKVVALADRLSAREREREEDQHVTLYLRSLLPDLALGVETTTPLFFPLRPLSRRVSELYPLPAHALPPAEDAYRQLWRGLEEVLRRLRDCSAWEDGQEEAYLDGLLACLQLYLWSVPSATYQDLGDISLYEHMRLAAAIAAAIAQQEPSEEALDRALANVGLDAIAFDLVAGDVSGVQDFIYTLTSRAVARGLRGRSFYLDVASELCARWLLKEVGLPSCNLIYSGGGRFYALCHPLEDTLFDRLRRKLADEFLNRFEGKLYVALARARVGADVLAAEGDGPGPSGGWIRRWPRPRPGASASSARRDWRARCSPRPGEMPQGRCALSAVGRGRRTPGRGARAVRGLPRAGGAGAPACRRQSRSGDAGQRAQRRPLAAAGLSGGALSPPGAPPGRHDSRVAVAGRRRRRAGARRKRPGPLAQPPIAAAPLYAAGDPEARGLRPGHRRLRDAGRGSLRRLPAGCDQDGRERPGARIRPGPR